MVKQSIGVEDLNDAFDKHLGQNYVRSMTDGSGCSMGRNNSTWLSPKLVCELVGDILESLGVKVEGELTEPEEEDDA